MLAAGSGSQGRYPAPHGCPTPADHGDLSDRERARCRDLGRRYIAPAWLIAHFTLCFWGHTAPKAAGVIHTDFERGFIKAETVAYDDLVRCGSVAAAREKGLYRMEGKEYVVQDGDVMLFKFAV